MRQTLSPPPGEGQSPKTLLRQAKHKMLAWRFATTECLWVAHELSPADGAVAIATAAAIANARSVEIMAHPSFEEELRVLQSEEWLGALAGAPLGSYRELSLAPDR